MGSHWCVLRNTLVPKGLTKSQTAMPRSLPAAISSDINTSSNDQGYSGEYRGRVRRLLRLLTVVLLGHLTIDKLSDDILLRTLSTGI